MRRLGAWRAAGVAGAVGVLFSFGVAMSEASPTLSVTSTSTTSAAEGTTVTLAGMFVDDPDAVDTLAVTVSTSVGTVHLPTRTGITLAYGSSATSSSVSFTGRPYAVNAALADAQLIVPSGAAGSSATVTVTAYREQPGIVYGSATGHFYEYVSASGCPWDYAYSAASSRSFLGKTGYLVTITSSDENAIVTNRIPGALNVWIGAQAWDPPTEGIAREWRWVGGPENGMIFSQCSTSLGTCDFVGVRDYSNWSSGEPNNGGNEWVAVTNWNGPYGQWNDLAATNTSNISGYVVEYGDGSAFTGVVSDSSTVAIVGVPGAPTAVSASPGSEKADVSFTAPTWNGGSAITGYTVTASPGGATTACSGSPCEITGLTAEQSYTFTVTATNAVGTGPASSPSSAITVWPQPSPPGTPTGLTTTPLVGVPYSSTVSATGFPPPTFSITTGALPDGLSLNSTTGVVSGTPTATGLWSVEITATNGVGSDSSTSFAGYVGQVPSITTTSIGDLPVGDAVDMDLAATGFPAPTWSVSGGSLPSGLSLSAGGRLTGTPTVSGTYSVELQAANTHGASTRTFTGAVLAPPGAITGTISPMRLGQSVSVTLGTSGYPAPTFAVIAGEFPVGVSLNTATGEVSGAPAAIGPWSAAVRATNIYGTAERVFSSYVGTPPTAVIGVFPPLQWNTPAVTMLSANGYISPTWSVTAGALPAGLTLNSTTGVVIGTPSAAGAYSVTIAATNDLGSADATFTGTVAAVLPSAPTSMSARPGDGEATAVFGAPDSDGGSPVTGYEVSVDGGAWTPLTTTVDGSETSGTVTGLANGESVVLRVRAITAVGAGPASSSVTVRPVAPPPSALAAPTVQAKVSSVLVTWQESTDRDVTGYTVTATPGGATCTTTVGTTSCLIAVPAGQEVSFTVVTHSEWGDSAPSQASRTVVATSPPVAAAAPSQAPTTLTTTQGDMDEVRAGQVVTVLGSGFAPGSTAVVVMYSEPRVLGSAIVSSDGTFRLPVVVPLDLAAGDHTFVAYGIDPEGATHVMTMPVRLPASATYLAMTGGSSQALAVLGFLLVLAGAVLRFKVSVRQPVRVRVR